VAEERSYMTAQDMASKYKITPDTVRRRVLDGAWPCDRIGRLYRFSPDQQDEIAEIVAGSRAIPYDKTLIAAALRRLSADA